MCYVVILVFISNLTEAKTVIYFSYCLIIFLAKIVLYFPFCQIIFPAKKDIFSIAGARKGGSGRAFSATGWIPPTQVGSSSWYRHGDDDNDDDGGDGDDGDDGDDDDGDGDT